MRMIVLTATMGLTFPFVAMAEDSSTTQSSATQLVVSEEAQMSASDERSAPDLEEVAESIRQLGIPPDAAMKAARTLLLTMEHREWLDRYCRDHTRVSSWMWKSRHERAAMLARDFEAEKGESIGEDMLGVWYLFATSDLAGIIEFLPEDPHILNLMEGIGVSLLGVRDFEGDPEAVAAVLKAGAFVAKSAGAEAEDEREAGDLRLRQLDTFAMNTSTLALSRQHGAPQEIRVTRSEANLDLLRQLGKRPYPVLKELRDNYKISLEDGTTMGPIDWIWAALSDRRLEGAKKLVRDLAPLADNPASPVFQEGLVDLAMRYTLKPLKVLTDSGVDISKYRDEENRNILEHIWVVENDHGERLADLVRLCPVEERGKLLGLSASEGGAFTMFSEYFADSPYLLDRFIPIVRSAKTAPTWASEENVARTTAVEHFKKPLCASTTPIRRSELRNLINLLLDQKLDEAAFEAEEKEWCAAASLEKEMSDQAFLDAVQRAEDARTQLRKIAEGLRELRADIDSVYGSTEESLGDSMDGSSATQGVQKSHQVQTRAEDPSIVVLAKRGRKLVETLASAELPEPSVGRDEGKVRAVRVDCDFSVSGTFRQGLFQWRNAKDVRKVKKLTVEIDERAFKDDVPQVMTQALSACRQREHDIASGKKYRWRANAGKRQKWLLSRVTVNL